MKAPRCPLHVSREMTLAEIGIPTFVYVPGEEDLWNLYELCAPVTARAKEKPQTRRHAKMRKIWKCPVDGCRCVAACLPTDEELGKQSKRICPSCGEEYEVTESLSLRNSYMCTDCRRERFGAMYQRKRRARIAREAA